MKIYVVTMYRWGDHENHSYVLGAYADDIGTAIREASNAKNRRGNKYSPEVLCFDNTSTPPTRTVIFGLEYTSYVTDTPEETPTDTVS